MAQVVARMSVMHGLNYELAEEGSYFLAKNPTAGTGLATIATPTTIADVSPFGLVKGPTTVGKRTRFDYLKLTCTAPGTAGTALRVAFRIDPVTKADPTAGATITPANVNTDAVNLAESKVFFGPLVAAAASGSVREIIAPLLKNAIPAIGDVYLIKFGGADQGVSTTAGIVYAGAPPIILGVGAICGIHLVLPSQSAASSYEVELGMWER